jgi:hypothetical protein
MSTLGRSLLTIFWNGSESRLRTLWRLLITIFLGLFGLGALRLLALFVITFLLMLTAQVPFSALGNGQELTQAINTALVRFPLLLGIRWLIVLLLVGLAFGITEQGRVR